MQLQGFIRNAEQRNVSSKKTGKSYAVYDAELHQDDGKKIQISFGFDKPEVNSGDYVTFEAFVKNGFLQVDQSTIERLDPPKQAVAQKPATVIAAISSAASEKVNDFSVREFGYKTHPEDAKRITFAAANDRAIKTVALLLQHDALPHSKGKGKGGEAQRYQELMAAIDKVTVKIYNDSLSLRTMDVVADEGIISVKAASNLPADPQEASPPSDSFQD